MERQAGVRMGLVQPRDELGNARRLLALALHGISDRHLLEPRIGRNAVFSSSAPRSCLTQPILAVRIVHESLRRREMLAAGTAAQRHTRSNRMTKRLGFLLLAITLGIAGMVAMGVHPQAEEVEENEPPAVSESDIELYIKVYTAMQNDHDLTIDSAIKPYHLSLEDFRKIELRIQNQPRLVERV